MRLLDVDFSYTLGILVTTIVAALESPMPVQYARCSGTSPHAACLTCSRLRCTAAPSQVSARARGIVSAVDSRRHAATAQSARSRVSARAALHDGESRSALLHERVHARVNDPPLARGQSSPSPATRAGEWWPELPRWPIEPQWLDMVIERGRWV